MDKQSHGRALIVEDARAWQELVGEILMECGLVVDVAESVESATLLARQLPHRLAVVDLALGEGQAANRDGLHVLASIGRQDPGCVTILLTGYATVELAVRAMSEYGAASVVQKADFERSEFRALVRRALAVAPPHDHELRVAPPVPRSNPRTDAGEVAGDGVRSAADGRGPMGPATVLVIDDDAGWRSILAELLSEAGYRVRLCNGYGEAVGCLRRDAYAMAVVDLSLDGRSWAGGPDVTKELDGYQLLALARDLGVVTIVLSGVGEPQQIERAYGEYEVFSYIEKQSFDRRAFLETLREVCVAREAPREIGALTAREVEVLALLALGQTNKEIADALVVSPHTIKRHLKAIFDKLGVHTRAAAAAKAISVGLAADR
jgi:DNA-binding NarL/FixJ family response regulator